MGYLEDRGSWAIARSPMCPQEFHEMGAVFELGSVIGPNIYMEFASGRVYLKPRCLAVAGSAVAKKTTGFVNPSKDILGEVASGLMNPPFERCPDTSTPEGFFYTLMEMCGKREWTVAHWILDEYSRYFESLEKPYMTDAVEALISALDGQPESRRLATAKKPYNRRKCHMTILAATVQENIERCVQPWHFTSGLNPRFFIRFGTPKKFYPRPLWTPQTSNSVFVDRLKRLATDYDGKETEMRWTPEAQKLWDRWCCSNYNSSRKEDSAVQAIHARAEDNLLMLAMARTLSERMTYLGPKCDMDADCFRWAAAHVRPYIADASRLYECCGTKAVVLVRKILSRAGGKLERAKLMKAFSSAGAGGKRDLDEAVETLIESAEVIVHGKETDARGRPGQIVELVGRR